MSSSYPFSDSIPGIQCHNGAQFTFAYTHRDEVSMDLDSEWMSNVDPQLRNPDTSLKQWNDQPLQRFLGEPQKPLFTTRPYPQYESFQQDFNRPSTGPTPHPYVYKRQIYSPAPSSQERYSICSSGLSPDSADNNWTKENFQQEVYQGFDSSPLSRSTSHTSQGVPDLIWPSKSFPQDQVVCGVSLSQLQGIPDEGDIIYQEDEGFMENMETDQQIKTEFQESRGTQSMIKQETPYPQHRQSIDEGLGHSIKDEFSPSRRSSYQPIDSDLDAEGEVDPDDETPFPEQNDDDEDEDDEYKPRGTISSTRRRRRISTKTSPTSPLTKRTKITKSHHPNSNTNNKNRTTPPFQCPTCTKNAFANASSLQKHISSIHTRAYICTFSFAGCTSRFASKNEWKRHVSSQHLCLNYWRCDVGICSKSTSPTSPNTTTKSNEFNRKDLFTQHLRRMHAPFAVKRQGRKLESWEDRVRELQISSLRVRREAPGKMGCVVGGCRGKVGFEGRGSWEEGMEHLGRHLERGEGEEEIMGGVDGGFLEWCLREGVVVEGDGQGGRGWRLSGGCERGVGAGRGRRGGFVEEDGREEDEDAEGEDDV